METKKFLFTSESVTSGHPDKIADQISDAILDKCLEQDPESRVACDIYINSTLLIIGGEITTNAKVNWGKIARNVLKQIGYKEDKNTKFSPEKIKIIQVLSEQSPDIAQGLDQENKIEQGAGDQGIMFGYATNETGEYMPLTTVLAHKLARRLEAVRTHNIIPYLRPDGKTQVTIEYKLRNNILKPYKLNTVVIAAQHNPGISVKTIREDIIKYVIKPVCGILYDDETKTHINRTGKFVIGGPEADTGLTGRKIIVDTYGGFAKHGGGCFSGKDPSKVDRSGAYAARWVAKNIVAAKLADRCEIQIGYAIGVSEPVSININCFGTENIINEKALLELIKDTFDLRPGAIIEKLNLKRPIYLDTACYGHFGKNFHDYPWEKLNMIGKLLENMKNLRTGGN